MIMTISKHQHQLIKVASSTLETVKPTVIIIDPPVTPPKTEQY